MLSPNGNQQSERVRQSNKTTDPLVLPITAEELAEFIALPFEESDRGLLEAFIAAACDYYIQYTGCELLSRDYTLDYSKHPELQQAFSGLAPMSAKATHFINLPVWPVSAVASVTVDGDAYTDYTTRLDDKPSTIDINTNGRIIIEYSAGYATAAEIPSAILYGIKLMAGALYETRGQCDHGDVAQSSGAVGMWTPHRLVQVI